MYLAGIDLVEIDRIKKALEREGFVSRYFGEREIKELKARSLPPQSVAGAFAAKEAFSKALGTGVVGFSLCEVELLHKQNGAPYLHLSGRAKEIAEQRSLEFSVSISHTSTLAQAIVIAYTPK